MADNSDQLDLQEILRRNPHIELERVREYCSAITKKQGDNYNLLHPLATPRRMLARPDQASRTSWSANPLRQGLFGR